MILLIIVVRLISGVTIDSLHCLQLFERFEQLLRRPMGCVQSPKQSEGSSEPRGLLNHIESCLKTPHSKSAMFPQAFMKHEFFLAYALTRFFIVTEETKQITVFVANYTFTDCDVIYQDKFCHPKSSEKSLPEDCFQSEYQYFKLH